jgi:hypothetical protein
MLLGANQAQPSRALRPFSAQWRDPVVSEELAALGFEQPAQLGSLFMADSPMLKKLTAAVAPVTDNFPLRISSRLVSQPGRVPLYELLMDERQRVRRWRRSEQVRLMWPAELLLASEPFFVYERMIKNHFAEDVYRHSSDPFLWEAIDDLLTNTSLTTLPLWLLGSDRDAQQAMNQLRARGEHQPQFELELALQATTTRDFSVALMHTEAYVRSVGNVSSGVFSLYLYLLAKNGLLTQAQQIVDDMISRGLPEVDAFLTWFTAKYGLTREVASSSESEDD